MARPKVPLISKRATLELALRIIDEEGLDALSIRRLAKDMGVNAASFYHHFRYKDDILLGAAALALNDVRAPADDTRDWREWLIDNAARYRRALLDHPGLIPVLVKRHPLGIGLAEHDASAATLERQGVPREKIMPLLETLEQLALGAAMYRSAALDAAAAGEVDEGFAHLRAARRANRLPDDALFLIAANGVVDAIVEAPVASASRTRRTRAPSRTGRP